MKNCINSTKVLQIFKELGYEIVDTNAGPAIVFKPHNAFVFSLVTGSSYLDDDDFPFTAKGLTKLFNQVFSTSPIWGLIDGKKLGFTPKNISKIRPYVFEGPKYLLAVDIKDEADSRQWIKRSRETLKNPENYLLFRIETWKSGNGMEPLLEYLACHMFRQFDYIVETQIPLTATSGSPDFLAYNNKPLLSSVFDHLKFKIQGLHVIELAFLLEVSERDLAWPFSYSKMKLPEELCIIGEAKVGGSSPKGQLKKYSDTTLFSHQIALLDQLPVEPDSATKYLYISSTNNVSILDSTSNAADSSNTKRIAEYIKWNEFVAKCYLLANLDEDQLISSYQDYKKDSTEDPVEALLQLARYAETKEVMEILTANL
jgi:hypothetical protein